jgi:hypothetical protein
LPGQDFPYESHFKGAFTRELCGGCKNYKTWESNPQIQCIVPEDNTSVTLIICPDPEEGCNDAVGMYLYDNESGAVVSRVTTFCSSAVLKHTFVKGSAIPFTLLASTFEPGKLGKFVIFAFSDNKLTLAHTTKRISLKM